MVRLGHTVSVVVPSDGPLGAAVEHEDGIDLTVDKKLIVLRKSRLRDAFKIPTLPAQALNADFVVVWTLALALYVPILEIRRKKYYVAVHELLDSFTGGLLVRVFLSHSKASVTACSQAVATWLSRNGVAANRVDVVYPILEPPVPTLKLDPSSHVIGVVGRINGHKGHIEVCKAFQSHLSHRADWRLLLAGGPYPGQEAALEDLLEVVRADDRIQYVGEVTSFTDIAQAVDVVACFPTRPEPFGLVPLEAWRYGKLAVGYADGGAREVLEIVGGIGVPRPTGDASAVIAEAIERALLVAENGNATMSKAAVLPLFSSRQVEDSLARAIAGERV